MKTLLPEKLSLHPDEHSKGRTNERQTINRLIDVVAELTEVVEGKKTPTLQIAKEQLDQHREMIERVPLELKEQLLGEIRILRDKKCANWNNETRTGYTVLDVVRYRLALSDVEAIINRLIP